MKVSDLCPSKYLKASDLNGRTKCVTVKEVLLEDLKGQGNRADFKPLIMFQELGKGLIANKTNLLTIAAGLGDDTDGWSGKRIELFPSITSFQGKPVDCLRVRIPEFDDDVPH